MQFGYTIFYVADVRASIDFYERAFGLAQRLLSPDGKYGEVDSGAVRLAFAERGFVREMLGVEFADTAAAHTPPPVEIGFVTTEVAAAYEKAVAAGAVPLQPPAPKPWGQTVAFVRDLNGFLVEICTPVAPCPPAE